MINKQTDTSKILARKNELNPRQCSGIKTVQLGNGVAMEEKTFSNVIVVVSYIALS